MTTDNSTKARPLTLDEVKAATIVPKAEDLELLAPGHAGRTPGERSDVQKSIDAMAPDQFAAWQADNSPVSFTGSRKAVRVVRVAPDQVKEMKLIVRKAGELHGYGVQFGTNQAKPDEQGRVPVAWRMVTKRERKSKDK